MRLRIRSCLVGVVLLLSGCSNQTSPRLESIRPQLKTGTTEAELVKSIGQWKMDLGPDSAGNKRRLIYELDGKYRGKVLELRLRDDKLVSAVVLESDPSAPNGAFTKVVEEVLKAAE